MVRSIPQLGDEYEVIVTKKGDLDDISLRLELVPGQEGNEESVRKTLIDQLRIKTGLGYNLEFHEYGSLPRYDLKAKRFKDLRKDAH